MQHFNQRRSSQLRTFLGFLTLLMALQISAAMAAEPFADLILYNGKFLTADSAESGNYRTVQAVAIRNGRFQVVGTNEEALAYAGALTKKVDLTGRTVIPGLVETHDHLNEYAAHFFPERRSDMDPSIKWSSRDEGLSGLRAIASLKKPGEWIKTNLRGGNAGGANSPEAVVFPIGVQKGEITRFDLDKVTPNNPVRIRSIFFSPTGDSFVNTKGLEPLLARYGPDLPGIHKDAKGVPTGWLSGVADQTIEYEFATPTTPSVVGPYYRMEMDEVAAQGLTTVSVRLDPDSVAAYNWLNVRGELPIRMAYTMETAARSVVPEAIISRIVGMQGGSGDRMWGMGDDMLWTAGLSVISIDSTPGIAGSCVSKSYPREAKNFYLWRYQFYGPNGLCRLTDSNYRDADLIRAAAKYGFRVAGMHTGGDKGIDDFFDLAESLAKQYPDLPARRWAIDHCRYLSNQHAARAKKLGIMFSCGPKYVYAGDRGDIGAFKEIFGDVAQDVVVPWRRLLDQGLRATMELDQHAFHPMTALQVAVNRKDVTGKVWGPEQRINRNEALYTYTRWAADYTLKEKLIGTIEVGKYADLVVLTKDYLTVPEDEIGRLDPLLTMVGGKPVYTEPDFAASVGLSSVGYRGDRSYWVRGTPDDAKRTRGEE